MLYCARLCYVKKSQPRTSSCHRSCRSQESCSRTFQNNCWYSSIYSFTSGRHARSLAVCLKDVERSYSVLRDRSLGLDRTDHGPRSQRPIKTAYFKNFKLMISHRPVIVERRNTAHWIRHDETRRMVVIAYF